MASMLLSDGRRLVVSSREGRESRPAPPASRPPPYLTERRARPDTADMRFRLLAEHSIDLIVAVDADLAIATPRRPPPRCWAARPPTCMATRWPNCLAPEDRAAFPGAPFHPCGPARRGARPVSRAAGATAARCGRGPRRLAAAGNGLGDFLVTFRDADQRRRAEESLGRMNAELSTLASTDALTGLPNRRQFDATLHKEWYARYATPRRWGC